MEQDELFGEYKEERGAAYARGSDPDTSHEAAEEVSHKAANRYEKMVYNSLRTGGPMTTHDLVENLGLAWNTISPRIKPLRRKGMVRDTGKRRIGPAGKRCIVWDIVRHEGDDERLATNGEQ